MVAQSLAPQKSTIEHNNKMRNCLSVKLDPDPKTLKKAWVSFLQKEYALKLKGAGWFTNKDLLHNEEVTVKKLSPKIMDFYTQIVEDENGSEMKVFASLGYDIYINEEDYPMEFNAMNEMMVTFLKKYLPEYYNKKVNQSMKSVKGLNKDIANLKENIKDNQDRIKKLNQEIEKYKANIVENSQKLDAEEIKLKDRQKEMELIRIKLEKL
jgi:prefoldin subunit 5